MSEPSPDLQALKADLDNLQPLEAPQIHALWPMFENDAVYFTYATNAIEGSTLSAGETTVILADGVTIGGKTVREHLDAINGHKAYLHMLELAKNMAPITEETIKDIHSLLVGENSNLVGGLYRDHQNWITGSMHVPPAYEKVRPMMADIMGEYDRDITSKHPIVAAAKLHYNITAIHPFADYNGRTARLVMNLSLIEHGFPPVTIKPGEERARYFTTLEASSMDPKPFWPNRNGSPEHFVIYVADMVKQSMTRHMTVLNQMGLDKESSHDHNRGGGRN